jgi:4-hydroxybutyrate CoA-transferase
VSTIAPLFEKGQIVSIPREVADTVVTEHGVATLLGKSVRERAEALIEIAHPDHRAELRKAAHAMYWP